MEKEQLKIFTEQGVYSGVSMRDEVHSKGLWHETFHCWIISRKNYVPMIHFQLRSADKKDFPDMLDISAAGHLLSDETTEDGIRELHEELGINISFNDLIYAGKIRDEIYLNHFTDREFAHVYIYVMPDGYEPSYQFQKEEVSGMMDIDLKSFESLWSGEVSAVQAEGQILRTDNQLQKTVQTFDKTRFVPHQDSYINQVIHHIKKVLDI